MIGGLPELSGFFMEWHFDAAMDEFKQHGKAAEPILLANMRGDGNMAFPVEHEGKLRGFMRPVNVELSDDGRVMRVEFDTGDVALPVYSGESNPEED